MHKLCSLCDDHEVGPRENKGLSARGFLQKHTQKSVLKDLPWTRSGSFCEKQKVHFIPTSSVTNATVASAADRCWGPWQVSLLRYFTCC